MKVINKVSRAPPVTLPSSSEHNGLESPQYHEIFEVIKTQERLQLVMECASEEELVDYPLHHSHMKERGL